MRLSSSSPSLLLSVCSLNKCVLIVCVASLNTWSVRSSGGFFKWGPELLNGQIKNCWRNSGYSCCWRAEVTGSIQWWMKSSGITLQHTSQELSQINSCCCFFSFHKMIIRAAANVLEVDPKSLSQVSDSLRRQMFHWKTDRQTVQNVCFLSVILDVSQIRLNLSQSLQADIQRRALTSQLFIPGINN